MKELKDYAHLYIGCRLIDEHNDVWLLAGFTESEVEPGKTVAICKLTEPYDKQVFHEFYPEEVKLILRPLDEMSDAESTVYAQLGDSDFNKSVGRKDYYAVDKMAAHQVFWALKKGFDLFNLKDAGLAVYE